MTAHTGIDAYVAFASESTVGTYVAPTLALPFVSESLHGMTEPLETAGIIAGNRFLTSDQWNGGNTTVGGDVALELSDIGMALVYKLMLGSLTTTGASTPYTHTATPGDMTGVSASIQVGRPYPGGGLTAASFTGCKVGSWELACAVGEVGTLGLTILAMDHSTSESAITPSYTSGAKPLKFNHGDFSLGGAAYDIKSISIKGDNHLSDDRRFIGSQTIKEPLEVDLREYTFELDAEYDTTVEGYANAEEALSLVFTRGTNTLTVAGNARVDDYVTNVSDRGILQAKVTGKFIASTTSASALTITAVDTVATP